MAEDKKITDPDVIELIRTNIPVANEGNNGLMSIDVYKRIAKRKFSIPSKKTVYTGFFLEGVYSIHINYTGSIAIAVISSYATPNYISNEAGLSNDKSVGFYFGRQETNGELCLINNTNNSEIFASVSIERL